ncbi:MAG: FkbM family methyltransferase [Candidatus Korobacteraceae bacterium]
MLRLVKEAAIRFLPDLVLQPLKRRHYARVLRSGDEEPEFAAIRPLIHPGDVVLDLGANIGVFTHFLSRIIGPEGSVISLEPVPLTFHHLAANSRHLANVNTVNAAVSDSEGTTEMQVPHYESGGENFYEASISARRKGCRSFTVRTTTVDSLCQGQAVRFIKCDVEGHEEAVIGGALQTIRRCRPAWMIEVSKPRVYDLMNSLGYEAYWFDGSELRSKTPSDHPINAFFLPNPTLTCAPEA